MSSRPISAEDSAGTRSGWRVSADLAPRQLPNPPTNFVNRLPELAVMDRIAPRPGQTPNTVVLRGPGGVGKSAIALYWLNTVSARFSDGQLYAQLTLADGSAVDPTDVMGSFLRALGVPPGAVPDRRDEREGLYRSVTAGRALAVLLEDAVVGTQVRRLLPASGASTVVVTTRRPLASLMTEGPILLPVEPLGHDGATQLIQHHVGAHRLDQDPDAVNAIVAACGGLPVALCAAAAVLVLNPVWRMADLAADLRRHSQRVETLSVDDDLSIRTTFGLSYERLSPDAQRAYLAVGVQPSTIVTAELVAALDNTTVDRARASIRELVDASLIAETHRGVYRCHSIIHAHAHDLAVRTIDHHTRMTMEIAALEHLLHAAQVAGANVLPARRVLHYDFTTQPHLPADLHDLRGSLAWLDQHLTSLREAVHSAMQFGYWELAYQLGDALQPLFIVHKNYAVALDVNTSALEAAIKLNDRYAENNMRKRCIRVRIRIGDHEQAAHMIEEMLAVTSRRNDRSGRAEALKSLAGLRANTGDHRAAAEVFQEALDIQRELNEPRSEGLTLFDLGTALLNDGDHGRAAQHLHASIAILGDLPHPDTYNIGRAELALARAERLSGDLDSARRRIDTVLPLLADYGASHELAAANEELATIKRLSE